MTARYVCPTDHKHAATSTCYVHHKCRCTQCSKTRNKYGRNIRRFQGIDVWVSSKPTVRRLQALACIGWSPRRYADQIGLTSSSAARIREGDQPEVKSSTAARVAATYAQLCMTPNTEPGHHQTRAWARKHGWLGPLDWADIERGVIDE